MGLDVALVNGPSVVFALKHHVGLAESLFHVAQLVLDVAGDVALLSGVIPSAEALQLEVGGQILVDDGSTGAHGFLEGQQGIQHFVVDVDEGQGLFGDMGAGRGDGGNRVALVESLLVGHHMLGHQPYVALSLCQVDDLVLDYGEVPGSDNAKNAGEGLGPAGVDGAYAGMGVGAAKHLAVKHSGKLDVRSVLGGGR